MKMNFQNFQQKRYVIDSETKCSYSHHNPIKLLTKSIESSFCDDADVYILVTGNIVVKMRNAADTADIAFRAITQVAFKNCASFKDCRTEIYDTFAAYADFVSVAIPMYNVIEYSDNSGSSWGFKRNEIEINTDISNYNNDPLFKYKVLLMIQKTMEQKEV